MRPQDEGRRGVMQHKSEAMSCGSMVQMLAGGTLPI